MLSYVISTGPRSLYLVSKYFLNILFLYSCSMNPLILSPSSPVFMYGVIQSLFRRGALHQLYYLSCLNTHASFALQPSDLMRWFVFLLKNLDDAHFFTAPSSRSQTDIDPGRVLQQYAKPTGHAPSYDWFRRARHEPGGLSSGPVRVRRVWIWALTGSMRGYSSTTCRRPLHH